MNNKIFAGLIGSAFLVAGGPAVADGLTHVWECELEDDATIEQLEDISRRWVEAARTIEGAEEISVYLEYPYAGDDIGDFLFVMSAPSATAWGQFMDGYEGSAAEAVDEGWGDIASCDEAMIFRSVAMQ